MAILPSFRINPINHTHIVTMQAEYSAASRRRSIRYVLEIPASEEHCGFAEIEDVMRALRIEVSTIDTPIAAPDQKEEKP
jgi:hypothetical protein